MAHRFLINATIRLPNKLNPDSLQLMEYVLGDGESMVDVLPGHVFFRFKETVPRYKKSFVPLGRGAYQYYISEFVGVGRFLQVSAIGLKGVDEYQHFLLLLDWLCGFLDCNQVIGVGICLADPEKVDVLVCHDGRLYAGPDIHFTDSFQKVNWD